MSVRLEAAVVVVVVVVVAVVVSEVLRTSVVELTWVLEQLQWS